MTTSTLINRCGASSVWANTIKCVCTQSNEAIFFRGRWWAIEHHGNDRRRYRSRYRHGPRRTNESRGRRGRSREIFERDEPVFELRAGANIVEHFEHSIRVRLPWVQRRSRIESSKCSTI